MYYFIDSKRGVPGSKVKYMQQQFSRQLLLCSLGFLLPLHVYDFEFNALPPLSLFYWNLSFNS